MPLALFNHPFFLAAAAVVAIGVVVYELVTSQEEKRHRNRAYQRRYPPDSPRSTRHWSSSPSPDNPRPPRPSPPPPYSPDLAVLPRPNSPSNNLRKRSLDQTSLKESSSADARNGIKFTVVPALKEQSETSSLQSSQNINEKKFDDNNYSLNVLDKLTNDVKDLDESFSYEKNLTHNICDEESDSSENNLLSKPEKKLNQPESDEKVYSSDKTNKRKYLRNSKHVVKKSTQNHTLNKHFVNSSQCQTDSSSDYNSDQFESNLAQKNRLKYSAKYSSRKHDGHGSKNVTDQDSKPQSSSMHPGIDFDPSAYLKSEFYQESSSSSDDDHVYKMKVHKALEKDLYDKEINSPSTSSLEKAAKEQLPDSNFCKACKENHIDTSNYPCNHSILCAGCAVKFFRIYKKCSVCHEDVEFVKFVI